MFDLMPHTERFGKEMIGSRDDMDNLFNRCCVNEINDNQETQFGFVQAVHHEDQREEDRRKEPCEGFTYISTVGWICRRERFRRKALDLLINLSPEKRRSAQVGW